VTITLPAGVGAMPIILAACLCLGFVWASSILVSLALERTNTIAERIVSGIAGSVTLGASVWTVSWGIVIAANYTTC